MSFLQATCVFEGDWNKIKKKTWSRYSNNKQLFMHKRIYHKYHKSFNLKKLFMCALSVSYQRNFITCCLIKLFFSFCRTTKYFSYLPWRDELNRTNTYSSLITWYVLFLAIQMLANLCDVWISATKQIFTN